YLITSLFITSIFTDSRTTLWAYLLLSLSLLVAPLLYREFTYRDVIAGPLALFAFVGGMLVLENAHRHHLECDRRAQLQETQRQYEALFEHSNDAVFILGFAGSVLSVNSPGAQLLGVTQSELVGENVSNYLEQEELPVIERRMEMLRANQQPPLFEQTIVARDGSRRIVEINATTVLDGAGVPQYIQCIVRDITQHKQVAETLQRRNRDLTVLNQVITAATSSLDVIQVLHAVCVELGQAFDLPATAAFTVDEAAPRAVAVAEYRRGTQPSALGIGIPLTLPVIQHLLAHQTPLYIANAQVDPRVREAHALLATRGTRALLLVPIITRQRVTSAIVLDALGDRTFNADERELAQNAAAAVSQALEAAELHRELQTYASSLETTVAARTTELREALVQAQAADQAKSQFVSNVSHELRTPLTSIKLYLELLRRAPEHTAYFSALQRETDRLQYLIENLLQISRLDLKRVQVQPEPVDLNALVLRLAQDRQALFTSRGLELQIQPASDLPILNADPRLLEQVFTNILTNAMNYTPPGGQVRLITAREAAGARSWVAVSVIDTGFGMTDDDQQQLFKRFQRGGASQALNVPGTGLGLAISKEIVDLHKGRITVASELGKGSAFTVWLPYPEPLKTVK
ncbi:MAG: PAS domain S-box protein, partial [Anaerolineae bacterium]|nr:PAS domain S-box protein [Anaerolineae bacterium]